LVVQVKNNKVMRVVPLENEDVNECWIADRDRFSYEALDSADRLTKPMLKQGGEWKEVDWQTALEYVANGLQGVKAQHGPQAIGTLASPHSTAEELFLAASLTRGLGSQNIDTRLRAADFQTDVNSEHGGAVRARWLGTSVASLTTLQRALVIGSNIRKDQPLLAQRLRQAVRNGGKVNALNAQAYDWAMPVANTLVADAAHWVQALADIAAVSAKPFCWATQRRITPKHRACSAWPTGLVHKLAPPWVTSAKRPTPWVPKWWVLCQKRVVKTQAKCWQVV
jgi:NADH-quinone oxidoreductase subunit G